jgi:predicted aspartyl protease
MKAKKILISISVTMVQLLLFVCCIQVWGAPAQDELWAKAVGLASRNQDLIPGQVRSLTRELNNSGKVKNTSEVWTRFFETEDGQVQTELFKKNTNGKDVADLQKESKKLNGDRNYSPDVTDFSMPFSPARQSKITAERLAQTEMKDNQRCFVYDFRCPTTKGDTMTGKAWLNEKGIPVAVQYTYVPLSARLPKNVIQLNHEVHFRYENDDLWYPEKVYLELKSKKWFSSKNSQSEFTFSDYWKYKKPLALTILTGGTPVLDQAKVDVPFAYNDGYLYVKVKLNDADQEYKFLLDTGCGVTILDPKVAAVLNLTQQSAVDMNDGYVSEKSDLVTIKKISLGGVGVENCGVLIQTLDNLESYGLKVDGILGSNFLRFFTMRLDYAQQTLTFSKNIDSFSKEIASSHKVPLIQDDTGLIFASLGILNPAKSFKTNIDTGFGGYIIIPSHFLKEFKPAFNSRIVQSKGLTAGGMFGGSAATLSRLAEFTIGDLKINNLPVRFEDRANDFLAVGNDFWSHFTVIIDYLHSEMYLLLLKEKAMDTNEYTYGFGIKKDKNGQNQVIGIWKGSAADRSGLRIGDIVLRMTAGEESATSLEACNRLMDTSNTVHLFVRRGAKEKEIIMAKSFLLPEVKEGSLDNQ